MKALFVRARTVLASLVLLAAAGGACARKAAPASRVDSVPAAKSYGRSDAAVLRSCRGLTQQACLAQSNCQAIMGATPAGAVQYAGCFTAIVNGDPLLCAEAFTCAKGPPPAGRCLRFPSSCIPDDWTAVPHCDQAGCPSPSPSLSPS